jgi:hypothetical protein
MLRKGTKIKRRIVPFLELINAQKTYYQIPAESYCAVSEKAHLHWRSFLQNHLVKTFVIFMTITPSRLALATSADATQLKMILFVPQLCSPLIFATQKGSFLFVFHRGMWSKQVGAE